MFMKTIRNLIDSLFLPLLVLSISCAVFAQKDFPKIKPGKIYRQSGVTVTSPNQTDWQIVKAEKLETGFIKTNADGKYSAFVKTTTTKVYENATDLFENLEKLKQAEINNLDRDSLHYNRTNFKETPCLQYDGIFSDPAPNYKEFNMSGYLCRHPTAQNVLIQIEFSSYSNTRGFTEAELKLVKNFFEKVSFSKVLTP
jgi:hypothetical protein